MSEALAALELHDVAIFLCDTSSVTILTKIALFAIKRHEAFLSYPI
jgi:hypothetical protein